MKRDDSAEKLAADDLAAFVEHDREDAGFELIAGLVVAIMLVVGFAWCASPVAAEDLDSTAMARRVGTTSQRVVALAMFDAPAPAPKAKPRPVPTPSPEPIDIAPEPPPAPEFEFAPEAVAESPVLPPTPKPSPSPGLLTKENARPFHVDTQLGAVATLTGEAGTAVTPTFWVNADGPLAFGSKHSLGRIGARLGLSSAPGETFDVGDIKTYRAMEAGLWLGRVVGQLGEVSTTVIVEGTFATRLKGTNDPAPLKRTVRGASLGLRFDAKRSNASLVTTVGYDEATASCDAEVDCTGVHSGLAFGVRGQVPIADGAVLFKGEAALATGRNVSWLRRRDIVQVSVVVDPVAGVKKIRGK